ncbi:hypothetical protein CK203_082430 [Vitis vinifera]|uniref:DUF4283 domain-containing protein n=1 Tax=Vitis vinifera TaxID=29760 RepID=A0A438BNF7_VITVI|nr:hypothetical protein CK203_082430 [Vitis vinifera]
MGEKLWLLEGNLWLLDMGGNLLLLEFEFEDEAKRVSKSGVRRFRGRSFCLEIWNPSVGCLEGGGGGARLWARVLVETREWQHPSSMQVVAGSSCFALQLWWEEELCFSTVLPSHGFGARKLKDDEVALARAEGAGALASDKIKAVENLAQACEGASMDLGQHSVARAHSGLACAKAFGPGLEKALVSAKYGPPFKPNTPAPSSDLGQGSPNCPSCLRKRAFAPIPCIVGTPQMEAMTSPVAEISFPAETHNSQGKPSFPPISSRGEHFSSSTPFWALGIEREGDPSLVLWNHRQGRLKHR